MCEKKKIPRLWGTEEVKKVKQQLIWHTSRGKVKEILEWEKNASLKLKLGKQKKDFGFKQNFETRNRVASSYR